MELFLAIFAIYKDTRLTKLSVAYFSHQSGTNCGGKTKKKKQKKNVNGSETETCDARRTTLNLIPVRLKEEDEDKTVDALAAVYIKKLQFPLKTEKNLVCLTGKESCLNSHRANKSQLAGEFVRLITYQTYRTRKMRPR